MSKRFHVQNLISLAPCVRVLPNHGGKGGEDYGFTLIFLPRPLLERAESRVGIAQRFPPQGLLRKTRGHTGKPSPAKTPQGADPHPDPLPSERGNPPPKKVKL